MSRISHKDFASVVSILDYFGIDAEEEVWQIIQKSLINLHKTLKEYVD